MVAQLTTVAATRRIRVNTVAFDVECVLLMNTTPQGGLAIINGAAFRKADLAKYFMPHQMCAINSPGGDNRLGYLTVVPYGVSYVLTDGTEIDPNLTNNIDNVPVFTSNDEVARQILHYKHHARCFLMSETAFTLPAGMNSTVIPPMIFFTPPSASSFAWPWFNLTNTPEDLIIIPVPDIVTPYTTANLQLLELTCNLGHVVPDCAVRNCIYSTYQVIRGNEYGTRESIIDYL